MSEKAPIKIFFRTTPQKLTQAKVFVPRKYPCKNIFDQRNPRKNYDPHKKYFDPRNPRNPRNNWIHVTQAPTQPIRTHVTYVTT